MLVWINARNKGSIVVWNSRTETMFGCISKRGEAHRRHQSIIKVLQHLIFLRTEQSIGGGGGDATHAWLPLPAVPVRQISGSRIDIVKACHHGTWSGSPSCFTTQKIAEKHAYPHGPMHPNKEVLTPRPEEKKQTVHTHRHSQGAGCKSKACCMQTEQGESQKPRGWKGRLWSKREFITRERGISGICASFKPEFLLLLRDMSICEHRQVKR